MTNHAITTATSEDVAPVQSEIHSEFVDDVMQLVDELESVMPSYDAGTDSIVGSATTNGW